MLRYLALLFAVPAYANVSNVPIKERRYEGNQLPWFRKLGVIWFNGFPGVPKLPLVQRRRTSSSSLNTVAPITPEDVIEEKNEEDP